MISLTCKKELLFKKWPYRKLLIHNNKYEIIQIIQVNGQSNNLDNLEYNIRCEDGLVYIFNKINFKKHFYSEKELRKNKIKNLNKIKQI